MSVAEMFSAGPISITQVTASEGESSLGVSMPKSLTVIREELAKPDDQTISARE
jgi:sRNA-binding carbon storage regulator CsrA